MATLVGTDIEKAMAWLVGWKVSSFPSRDPARVDQVFGPVRGGQLTSEAVSILNELARIAPDWERHDLIEASKYAASKVVGRNPSLGHLAHDVLFWVYSFDYR